MQNAYAVKIPVGRYPRTERVMKLRERALRAIGTQCGISGQRQMLMTGMVGMIASFSASIKHGSGIVMRRRRYFGGHLPKQI